MLTLGGPHQYTSPVNGHSLTLGGPIRYASLASADRPRFVISCFTNTWGAFDLDERCRPASGYPHQAPTGRIRINKLLTLGGLFAFDAHTRPASGQPGQAPTGRIRINNLLTLEGLFTFGAHTGLASGQTTPALIGSVDDLPTLEGLFN